MKEFTVTSYPWRQEIAEKLRRAGHEAPDDAAIHAALIAFAKFLEDRGLTTRPLIKDGDLADGKQFAVRSSDLTETGLAVIRAGLSGWENKGCPADNLRPFERAYTKVAKNAP